MTQWLPAAALALVFAPGVDEPPEIIHDGVECVVAERFPRIEARIEATPGVARARVLFRSAGAAEWYEVAMKPEGGTWVAVLPQPKPTLKAFDYYIVVIDAAMGMSQTPEFHPFVGLGAGGCQGRRVTGALMSAAIQLQAPVGAPIVPAGFANAGVVGGSIAGGSTSGASTTTGGATGGSAAGAAAGGGSKGLMIALIGGGAAAAGVAAAAGGGDVSGASPTPASSTPNPSPTPAATPTATPAPTPTPAPSPTPTPTTGSLTGRWVGTLNFAPDSHCTWGLGMTLDLTQTGTNLSGSTVFTVSSGSSAADCEPVGTTTTYPIVSGSVNGLDVTFAIRGQGFDSVTLTGRQSGNTMSGTALDQQNQSTRTGAWNAVRQ